MKNLLWLAWKGVPRGWSSEIGRGQTVKGLTQQASQCGFFPEEPLEQGSDRIILSFQVISQAAMHRLEGMEMELGNLDVDLFEGSHFCMGLSLNFLR